MGDAYMMSLQQNEKLVVRGALASRTAIPGYIGALAPIMPGADAPGYPFIKSHPWVGNLYGSPLCLCERSEAISVDGR